MILTDADIELRVSQISGTHIKRNNLRAKLKDASNKLIENKIMECKGRVRDLRALGSKEEDLRFWYSEITNLELKRID